MTRYHVHIYANVRIKVCGVVAPSAEMAIRIADKSVNRAAWFGTTCLRPTEEDRASCEVSLVEDAESTDGFLVDVAGDAEYNNTQWFNADGKTPLLDGRSQAEHALTLVEKLAMQLKPHEPVRGGAVYEPGDSFLAERYLAAIDEARKLLNLPANPASELEVEEFIAMHDHADRLIDASQFVCEYGSPEAIEIRDLLLPRHGVDVYSVITGIEGGDWDHASEEPYDDRRVVYGFRDTNRKSLLFVSRESGLLQTVKEVINLVRAG
ncbi:MAG: hypothetical protein ING75_17390 [Rhodocyclaceae bacterium]|nr:hypothetical protein [Rhodocyclaceae bacterium]